MMRELAALCPDGVYWDIRPGGVAGAGRVCDRLASSITANSPASTSDTLYERTIYLGRGA